MFQCLTLNDFFMLDHVFKRIPLIWYVKLLRSDRNVLKQLLHDQLLQYKLIYMKGIRYYLHSNYFLYVK